MTLTTDSMQVQGGETAPSTSPSPARKPSSWVAIGWAAVIASFAAAIMFALVVFLSSGSSTESGSTPAISPHWPQGVPGSADAAERWLTPERRSVWPQGSPGSADAAERWATPQRRSVWPQGSPGSADAAERWAQADEPPPQAPH